ncbi:MAG: isoprenylcysteine carboxylmethyltransferase family protein [Actinobacteria bacterium]|nr:isoprenylcysteine carboxylmethyltransferase family protein [Actinomycetota bacterium]
MGFLKKLSDSEPEIRRNVIRRMKQFPAAWIFVGLLLFISAGTVKWPFAWYFLIVLVSVDLIGLLFIPLEVLAERGRKKEYVENWDKVLGTLIVLSMMVIFLITGFDYRWNWSADIDSGMRIASIAVFILACALEIWAMRVNRFFSDVVRIQSDREQKVCSSGPYKYIRHPGYLGMIAYYLVTPLILGSWWAMIPAFVIAMLFVLRTRLEDRTLHKKLPGYREYAARVKYRLIPGLW